MSNFEPSSSQDWYMLVEFQLDSVTLRYTSEFLVLDDATVWTGWLRSMTELRRSLGSILDPRIISPRMSITLDNANSQATDILDAYDFANRTVVIKAGYGTAAANYENIFTGVVHFPGGVAWDERTLTVEIDSTIITDDRVIPINRFFPSAYPNVEEKSKFLAIPLVYGDWRTTAGGGEQVTCFQTDSTAGTGGEFTIADHALKEIEVVYLDGVDITANCTLDAANAQFTITSGTYDPLLQTVTACVQGATDDGTTSGTMIITIPDIVSDILQTHLSVAAGSIDSAAFTAWGSELSADDDGRRVIDSERSAFGIITEALIDGFADMTIIDGKYFPLFRLVDVASAIPSYYDFDIEEADDNVKMFGVIKDPERVFANQIVADYRYNPSGAEFAQRYDVEDSGSIATYATRRRRRLTMEFLYKTTGAEARADREKFVFGLENESIKVTLRSVALQKEPTDQFRLVYSKYDLGGEIGAPFQIRDSLTNFKRNTITVTAWNMTQLTPGRWTDDSIPSWLLSSSFERVSSGYWTDASGYADTTGTPDEASKRSSWF